MRRRRTWVAAVVLAAIALLATTGCQWVMAGFDGGRSGANPYESTIGAGNVDELTELWSAPFGGATAVARGMVYATGAPGAIAPGGSTSHFQVFAARGGPGCS